MDVCCDRHVDVTMFGKTSAKAPRKRSDVFCDIPTSIKKFVDMFTNTQMLKRCQDSLAMLNFEYSVFCIHLCNDYEAHGFIY